MHHKVAHWHAHTIHWQYIIVEALLLAGLVVILIASHVTALRLQERSLYINNNQAGETTFYQLSFRYMSPDPVGSVELLFCVDPIPHHPCEVPPGMDVSQASLTDQAGETGFSLSQRSTNRLVLSREATAPADQKSSYTLDNIVNTVDTERAFSVRIRTLESTNATGPQIDFGSVRGQIIDGIRIITQVPPMLIFCLAQEVEYNCTGDNETYYSDMGELRPDSTLTAQSQMAVGTNASGGFSITAYGAPMSAGTNYIPPLTQPTASQPGVNQFGINLVENSAPNIGTDPEGEWANAVASDSYNQPDRYQFVSGDIVAYSPNVSLMKKFTVSYIVNSSPELRAGVYTTTINYIASGQF